MDVTERKLETLGTHVKAYWLEVCIVALQRANEAAKMAGLDAHVVSEIGHSLATAKANRTGVEVEVAT